MSEHPPRLVYDDECGFCTWCARLADDLGDFELVGFHELTPDQRARLPDDYETCAHLLTDDAVYDCGEAMEQALARIHPVFDAAFEVLRAVPGYPSLREKLYRWGADRRDWWGKIVRCDPPAKN
ncbi:DCC1-like thiol-disulfide oxidoreductase family protein [Salarchaeum japonicum]|uniref:DCC1-like thiol-disulfide oxidoreductase family protein n=1 Tax=Salarchaeum japonicum TaxID=555573 RepID=UPI003C71868C